MKFSLCLLLVLIACESVQDDDLTPIQLENKIAIQLYAPAGFSQVKFSALLDSVRYQVMKIANDTVILDESGNTDSTLIAFNSDEFDEGSFKFKVNFYDANGVENFKTAVADTQFIKEKNRPLLWRLFSQQRLVKFTLSAEHTDSISVDFKHITATFIDLLNDTLIYDSLKLVNKKLSINNLLAGTYQLKLKAIIKNDSVSSPDSLFFNQVLIGKDEAETISEIDALFD